MYEHSSLFNSIRRVIIAIMLNGKPTKKEIVYDNYAYYTVGEREVNRQKRIATDNDHVVSRLHYFQDGPKTV